MTLALHGKSGKRQAVLVVGALLAIFLGALAVFASGGAGAKADGDSQYHQGLPITWGEGYGFGDCGPLYEGTGYVWHFVTKGPYGFVSISPTFTGAGSVQIAYTDAGPHTNKHAFVYTENLATLTAISAVLDVYHGGFVLSNFCGGEGAETPTHEATAPATETATPVAETPTPATETATPATETTTPVTETATPETPTPVTETPTPETPIPATPTPETPVPGSEGDIEIEKYTFNGETWELYVGPLFTFDINDIEGSFFQGVGPGTFRVDAGSYTVIEVLPVLDWELVAIIQGGEVCPASPNGASGGPAGLDVTVADGETVLVCAYNQPDGGVLSDGQICIEKYIDFNGDGVVNGGDALIVWTGTLAGPGITDTLAWGGNFNSLNDCQYLVSGLIAGETYTITENSVAGWTATNATVNGSSQANGTTVSAIASSTDATMITTVIFHNQPDVVETPTPVAATPTAIAATPTPATETPTASIETPTPFIETPTNIPANTPTATPVLSDLPTSTPAIPATSTPTNIPGIPTATPIGGSTDAPTQVPDQVIPDQVIIDEVLGETIAGPGRGPGVAGVPIPPASGSGTAVDAGTNSMSMMLLALIFITSGSVAFAVARKRS